MGLTVLQGYGQTESGPVISCNRPKVGLAMDSVGPPMRGVEVRFGDDGEFECGNAVEHDPPVSDWRRNLAQAGR